MATAARKRPWSLIIIVVVAVFCLAYTIFTVNRPFLGLDLQGGVSVVLAPPKGTHPSSDSLDEAINIINQRINSFGVAEAQVSRQGSDILVEIPGVKDKDRALQLVGETAELQFRPVLGTVPVSADGTIQTQATPPTTAAGGSTSTTAAGSTSSTAAPSTTATTAGSTSTTAKASTSTSQKSLGVAGTGQQAGGVAAPPATVDELTAAASTTTTAAATSTTAKATATTTTAKGTTTTAKTKSVKASTLITSDAKMRLPATRSQEVVLPEYDTKTQKMIALYELGPTYVTGSGLSTASADLNQQGQWEVRPVFKSGAKGIDLFNKGAAECYSGATTCPNMSGASGGHGQMAIVLDNRVLTAPTIDNPSFSADQITISGSFTESQVHDIATALKYGALPVPLVPQTSEIVSATLGRDALHAGLVAGVVGFILVGLYMIAFYRILGLLAMFKLLIEGCILWGFLCWAGPNLGLAITLAGITGIVVSIGVSLDSNVVYYEHLKEDVRAGRTIRASVDKSFVSAWRTIWTADGASLLGAAILYFFTVGAVRGFAFYLGLSTALDLITSWCYMRPVVARATRSKMCAEHPHRFGLPDADDVDEASKMVRKLVTEGAS